MDSLGIKSNSKRYYCTILNIYIICTEGWNCGNGLERKHVKKNMKHCWNNLSARKEIKAVINDNSDE